MQKPMIRKLSLYLFIVVIPTMVIGLIYIDIKKQELASEHLTEARTMLNVHKNQIDYLIQETKARLETMAVMVNEQTTEEELQRVLTETYRKEPRFSGLLLLDNDGDILLSAQPLKQKRNLSGREFFQTALLTGQTAVSGAYYGQLTGNHIVSICTPIHSSDDDEPQRLLIAALRVDYLQNIMEVISPSIDISVLDADRKIVFQTGNWSGETGRPESTALHLNQLNWQLKASPKPINLSETISSVTLFLFSVFILLNVLFIGTQYYLLRRKAARENAQIDSQKLELVGTLAASTAHEIRNPLTGINGFIQLLKEKYKDEEDQFYFSVIDKEIKRINQIVSEFLVLGRPTAHHHKTHQLSEIIKEVLPIIQSEANYSNMDIQTNLQEDEKLTVHCTKDHIKQVVMNLAKNSLEAMEPDDTLSISVYRHKEEAVIEVCDTGKGIPEDILNKIFTPFFTLKDTGTGLGLVVCKRIINMYKGDIDIQSRVNQGTKVRITLPLAKGKL
ncbi:two-component sensor histidine kinase [Bacillus lacus]|uniref:histidine kinase n=1 Tax=Metabacillus lacus TaxID=1983721 RepID=A0A7X2M0A4_9BACI|nr:ATP-binding protein [Metabacillus lacus]MRX73853.1 two-component sensor histidine kinase [Metabacillus lacus]